MLSKAEIKKARAKALSLLRKAGIALTPAEIKKIEVADFGLGDLEKFGLEIVTYVNNARYCAKELVLFPGQICPEHRHPPRGVAPGKMETFRCRWGSVKLYGSKNRPVVLKPGQQATVPPDTLHWFQAGRQGAVVSEFSSPSDDASDYFSDPKIRRVP
ncbi:MAG: D-lyxose/D-mannose family sugar isomerase [candidate division FCPU426 bacterium]